MIVNTKNHQCFASISIPGNLHGGNIDIGFAQNLSQSTDNSRTIRVTEKQEMTFKRSINVKVIDGNNFRIFMTSHKSSDHTDNFTAGQRATDTDNILVLRTVPVSTQIRF